jgi:hypothetical protein
LGFAVGFECVLSLLSLRLPRCHPPNVKLTSHQFNNEDEMSLELDITDELLTQKNEKV